MKTLALFCFLIVSDLCLLGQSRAASNPYTSPEDVAAGERLFRSHCSHCHGQRGEGSLGPELNRGKFRHGGSDTALFRNISSGIPNTEMPGVFFQGKQIWQLVAYVRSLSQEVSGPLLPGDASRGETLFREEGGCLQCHMVEGEGGRQGPELTHVGDRRSLEYLRTSVLHPDATVSPSHWRVKVLLADGRALTGRRLNEDTMSLQILDSRDNLLSLLKSEIQSYEYEKTSPMPSYAEVLTGQEVEDLVAYLASLQNGSVSP